MRTHKWVVAPVLVVCFVVYWVPEPLAGDRWLAAAMLIVGSTIGGVMALFVAPSLSSGTDPVMCVAASIAIISHWLGRWYLRRVSAAPA